MAPGFWLLVVAIGLPFVVAAVTPRLHRVIGDRVGYLGSAVAAVSFGLLGTQVGTEGTVSRPWVPSLDVAVRFHVDGLALLFALLASGIGVLIFAYATSYMRGQSNLGQFYMALIAFMGSILGVALAADLLLLFLFWELTSVCSFVLIGYHTEDSESQSSARMAMLITVGGGLCLLVGIVFIAIAAEMAGVSAFNLAAILDHSDEVRAALDESGLFTPALVLVTLAAAAKSAQVPLYFWLPRAMVAPTPVSAFLHSATMVKVGVYALGRVRPVFHGFEWMVLVATLGIVTMTVGAVLAVLARDIKELLAYSTASHLGLMIAAFGFRSHYGAEAGVFHLLNHALFKAALFLVAGIIAHEAGTRHIDELGGLRHDLPVTAIITALAALSMAGIPPFNGFYSKEILFEAAWETAQVSGGVAWLYPAIAVFASVFTVLYSLRFLWLFFGDRPEGLGSVHRAPLALVVPPAVLAGAVAFVSVRPSFAIEAIGNDAARATAVGTVDIHAGIPSHLSGPVLMSATALLIGFACFPFYAEIQHNLERFQAATTRVHPTAVYESFLSTTDRVSVLIGSRVQNGLIRTYVWWLLLSACVLTGAGYASTAVGWPAFALVETPVVTILVLGLAVVAAIVVATAESHIVGVLTLSILGFMVAIFYILASGADLALTQLVVEALLLLIFLLVLEEIPAFYGELEWRRALRDAALSVVVGTTVFVSVLYAAPPEGADPTPTAAFYVTNAVPEGGGTNIVNVILTDFRAFDTLGESIVVIIAALSVLVLITMRDRGEKQ